MGQPAPGQVVTVHPGAVIHHPDPVEAPGFEVHLHGPGTRVERVVEKLPHDGKRPVDDLAGRNLARNILPEEDDPPGGIRFPHRTTSKLTLVSIVKFVLISGSQPPE